jgi:hypothetical protein
VALDRGLTRTNRRDPNRYRFCGGLLAACCWLVLGATATAQTAQVSGKLVTYEGAPVHSVRFLRFENMVTRDSFLMATTRDGAFGARLPTGVYALRAERGAILARGIAVRSAPIELGQVNDLAPLALARLWDRQSLAPSLIVSPAPSTARIMTADTTVLPPPQSLTTAPPTDLPLPKPDLGHGSSGAPSTGSR